MSNRGFDLVTLLESIADNKFVLGDRLVEVGVSGPSLEASLAAVAIAQGELGHARHLYNWSFALRGVQGEVREQTGKALPSLSRIGDWLSLIAGVYVFNAATEIVLNELLQSGKPDMAAKLSKTMRELKEHITFSLEWSKNALHETGAIPERFRTTLEEVRQEVGSWLSTVEVSTDLSEKGLLQTEGLTAQFQQRMDALLQASPQVS